MQTSYAVLTDAGPRHNNEDSYAVDAARGIYVICDGMGGHAAGERASKLAANAIVDHYGEGGTYDSFEGDPDKQLREIIRVIAQANRIVHEESNKDHDAHGMGSTVVCVTIRGDLLTVAHIGDSRAYLIREGKPFRLTRDHTYVMDQVANGNMSEEEARDSELSNYLTRALGPFEEMEADTFQTGLLSGDLLVLGTDGLCKPVQDDEIATIASGPGSLEDRCHLLIAAAASHGGTDNVTVAIIHLQ